MVKPKSSLVSFTPKFIRRMAIIILAMFKSSLHNFNVWYKTVIKMSSVKEAQTGFFVDVVFAKR